jgi:hypothetical protein
MAVASDVKVRERHLPRELEQTSFAVDNEREIPVLIAQRVMPSCTIGTTSTFFLS